MKKNKYIVLKMLALLLTGLLFSVPALAAAPFAPKAILAKVPDLQEMPSVDMLIGNAGSVLASKLGFGKMNQADKEDVFSFCTCPSEAPTAATPLPAPNSPINVNPAECGKIYAKQSDPFAKVVIGAVLTQVNKMLSGISEKFYKGLVASGTISTILGAGLVLYMVIYGIMVSTGMMAIEAGDTLNRLIKISILFALLSSTGWDIFTTYFGNIFLNGTLELANVFSQISQTGSPAASVSKMSDFQGAVGFLNRPINMIFSMKFFVMMAALPLLGPYGFVVSIILVVCILMFIWLVVTALITFLKALVGIYVMLGLAPIFISMFLFRRTREIFTGWINQLVTFFLQPILVFAFLGFFTTLFTNNLKGIVDKTEYCFVPFMPLFGDYIKLSWFRPAVLYDENGYTSDYQSEVSKAQNWMTESNLDEAGILKMVEEGKDNGNNGRNRQMIIILAAAGKLQQGTIDALIARKYFGEEEVADPANPGKTNLQARGPGISTSATSSVGQYLYAYKGSWDFHGPALPNAYATGRWVESKGGKGNDFPINMNDVMLFMLITFLGWRYSGLIGKLAEQMAGGVSNANSPDDTSKWFMSKLGGKNVMEEAMKKGSRFKNIHVANVMGMMANRHMSKAQETYRPDLVDPKNVRGNTKPNPDSEMDSETIARRDNNINWGTNQNASMENNRKLAQDAKRKIDEKVNEDTYFNTVKSRANKVREELQKDAALSDLSDDGAFGRALSSKFGKSNTLSKEQRDLIKMIDSETTSRDSLERALRAQKAKQGRKIEDYVRQTDKVGMDSSLSDEKKNAVLRKTADTLLHDELIIQRINKKLQGS